jgi:hypothetical protein
MREESPRHAEVLERARQEGRLEVLREVAKQNPFDDAGMCNFCGDVDGHKPDCLWLRAQQAVKAAETPQP